MSFDTHGCVVPAPGEAVTPGQFSATDGKVTVDALLARRASLFGCVKDPEPSATITLGDVFAKVRNGDVATTIAELRAEPDPDAAKKIKLRLPAVKASGRFSGRNATDLVEHSGVVCLDFDDVTDLHEMTRRLKADEHVLAFFRSPSGRGLKVFVPADANDAASHAEVFKKVEVHFRLLLAGVAELDRRPSNVAGNCFLSYDRLIWIAETPRRMFQVTAGGCGIDVPHVVQSNEKELPSLPSPSDGGCSGETSGESCDLSHSNLPSHPPAAIELPPSIGGEIYARWAKRLRYEPGIRNSFIVERVPILMNIVSPEIAACLLLKWYDEAPPGMFSATRDRHWQETRSAVEGCLRSWSTNAKVGLSASERRAYMALRNDRERTVFRICRSLSRTKENRMQRTFFLTHRTLAERLGCHDEVAARQLRYLEKRRVIEVVEMGTTRRAETRAQATRYRWAIPESPLRCNGTQQAGTYT